MTTLKWWQTAVFYQVYPRSFADGNGDGIGDLHGLIEKLDYLQSLGIDAIWLSPHYPSPQFDCGYDIADYTNVEPEYGTLQTFRTFLDEAHRRDIRVILDLVLNHTSDQHPWFLESRSSRHNPKRDWYVWADPGPDNGPPNNWYSVFGGPAWEFDETTGSYYYHFFFKEQPDLNWRNPAVKEAMFDAVRFWLNMGVDGFRLDAIGTIYEDPDLTDHDSELTQVELYRRGYAATTAEERAALREHWEALYRHQRDQPGVHELMQELRALVDEYDDRMLVGETDEISFHGTGDDELHLVFNFPLARTERLTPQWVRDNQETRLALLPHPAWPGNTFGNHDQPRVYSRFGDDDLDARARLNLILLLTLKGTPFLYNGEEIGMSDYPISDPDQVRDNWGLWAYRLAQEVGGIPEEEARNMLALLSRDKCRTPMQWANAPNGGFSPPEVSTWLPVNPDYAAGVNVADQEDDLESLLNFYRAALQLRRENPALLGGDYQPLAEDDEHVLVYLRTVPEQRCLVALNLSAEPQALTLHLPITGARRLFSTHPRPDGELDLEPLALAPYEALVVELS